MTGYDLGDKTVNSELPAIHLAGPTAVGKSAIALELAERLRGEIITVDSMQVYRGLDIGTAKPSREESARVPHHLIDVVDLSKSFDVAQFISLARCAESDVRSRGHLPIFCGGTGFYFKALFDGLSTTPPSDTALRLELESTPMPQLLEELARRDSNAYAAIDRQNPRRVIRALEVIRLTQRPYADFLPPKNTTKTRNFFVLNCPAAELNERIHRRVDGMLKLGLVEETRVLLNQGLRENKTALQALGYRQVTDYIDGKHTFLQTVDLIKSRTRQFAKRQLTFFKHQFNAHWIDHSKTNSAKTVDLLLGELDNPQS